MRVIIWCMVLALLLQMNAMYEYLTAKRKAMEAQARLLAAGAEVRPKYEYDSDEDTDGGTWEHKKRMAEMEATRGQSCDLWPLKGSENGLSCVWFQSGPPSWRRWGVASITSGTSYLLKNWRDSWRPSRWGDYRWILWCQEDQSFFPLIPGTEGWPWTWPVRLQAVQDHMRERRIPDADQNGLEGRGGAWGRGAGH